MKVAALKRTRNYTMRARAESTIETRERILDAVIALSEERLSLEIVLADVAERSGVSVQTVLRHFGDRRGLFEEARARQVKRVRAERAAPAGDAAAAVRTIVAFYERMGEWSLMLQAQEHSDELSRQTVELARRVHREWLTWKFLRRDGGMSRAVTCDRMLRLVQAVLHKPSKRS